jgi:hypothetical protein
VPDFLPRFMSTRTDRDWDRWIEYIAQRTEVIHIAFEFGTGAGWQTRIAGRVEGICGICCVLEDIWNGSFQAVSEVSSLGMFRNRSIVAAPNCARI